jgi:hypothetical protein
MVNISSQPRFCTTPIRKMTPMTANEKMDNRFARSSMATWRGVLFSSTYLSAILCEADLLNHSHLASWQR